MDVEKQEAPRVAGPYLPGLREHCHREVDIDGYSVALPLALYCVTAGFVGAIVFSATWSVLQVRRKRSKLTVRC
jgi:hypothetical protein